MYKFAGCDDNYLLKLCFKESLIMGIVSIVIGFLISIFFSFLMILFFNNFLYEIFKGEIYVSFYFPFIFNFLYQKKLQGKIISLNSGIFLKVVIL